MNELYKIIRALILESTTIAGSGHPSSCLSAVEFMTTLFFGGYYRYDIAQPNYYGNDRVIFSKGHAAPLLYALYTVAGALTRDDLLTLRTFHSSLEGHPTPRFPHTVASTGSLGQGLSIGAGVATMQKQVTPQSPRTFVLLGDSEMAEGQVWEAMGWIAHQKLSNIIAIVDVNRLGQRGETMLGWDISNYSYRAHAFGWEVISILEGHDEVEIKKAYDKALEYTQKPKIIFARTIKGKGVSFMENQNGWHGKPVPHNRFDEAMQELGKVDYSIHGEISKPPQGLRFEQFEKHAIQLPTVNEEQSTREAYGDAVAHITGHDERVVVLDAEMSNSTFSQTVKELFPNRFFEMYIAEQNMVSVAVGMAAMGMVPFLSSFASFLTRSFDQIRMAQYSHAHIVIVGSHCGVSMGEDGSSQMGLEDIAVIRSIRESAVLYPSDTVSTHTCTSLLHEYKNIGYLRITRAKKPQIYSLHDEFHLGGSHLHGRVEGAQVVIVAAGITLHEALEAQKELNKNNIGTIVIDAYSVKPLDTKTIQGLVNKVGALIVAEDHYPNGGIGEAVTAGLAGMKYRYKHLAVFKEPRSGTPQELLEYEEISSRAIIAAVSSLCTHNG